MVNNLSSAHSDWSQAGRLIKDTKALFNSSANWSAKHIRRACNKIVHVLAQKALSLHDLIGIEEIPLSSAMEWYHLFWNLKQ